MVDRALQLIRRRLQLLIGRAVIRAAKTDGGRVEVTLDMLAGETSGNVEFAEPWGITSIPLAGAEALALSVMAERGNKVAISLGDRRHRPRDGVPGETILFDDQGQQVAIRRNEIVIRSPKCLRIEAADIKISSDKVTINGQPVATVGHVVAVDAGSSRGEWPIATGVGSDD